MRKETQVKVVKRNGTSVPVSFEKVLSRIEKQSYKLDPNFVVPFEIAKKVLNGIYDGVTTRELDTLAIETAAYMGADHPDYSKLAARLAVSAMHKETDKSFSKTMQKLYDYIDPTTGEHAPLVSLEFNELVQRNATLLDNAIIHNRDYMFEYFGYKTLSNAYLLRMNGKIAERPQYMYMRAALGIHGEDLESALKSYDLMSEGWFTHATPTLFNAGTPHPQLSSCFLLKMHDDSIDGIFKTLTEAALISKNAGGIGIAVSNIRPAGSYIKSTGGTSNGLVPFLRIFNETARTVDQGGGKRKGAFAMYLEPWHGDIFEFLDLKKNHGKEEMRARDLFYGLWIPDLFMQRVEQDLEWSLMCPVQCPGLDDVYGEEFIALYEKYEAEGKFLRKVRAQEIWTRIIDAQTETGTPYLLYKDSVNKKSNQANIGTIKTSNLCAEVVEVVTGIEDPDPNSDVVGQTAVCNLASVALPKFVKGTGKKKSFDHEKLVEVTYTATVNLNKVIDVNYYPTERGRRSNRSTRPIATGVQGLADTFIMLGMPFESAEARQLNKDIAETMYYAALRASCDLAKIHGPYELFEGSPASKGILQFDMWGVTPSSRYDWEALRADIIKHGLRNSLLLALMPTASTASIFGNEASAEANNSNIYTRRVLAGEFIIVNTHLVRELCARGLWNKEVKNAIITKNGSVQGIDAIPADLQLLYKTVWEISQKAVIDQYADRGAFIDQTQSMNLHIMEPNHGKLTSMHFYGWGGGVTRNDALTRPGNRPAYGSEPEKALKTGVYYLRTKAAADAIKFTVDPISTAASTKSVYTAEEAVKCSLDDPDSCMACGA